jgi:hypothetical protein
MTQNDVKGNCSGRNLRFPQGNLNSGRQADVAALLRESAENYAFCFAVFTPDTTVQAWHPTAGAKGGNAGAIFC